jgi:hypothetical protein
MSLALAAPRVLSDAAMNLQSELLHLAQQAAAGSEMRRILCEAAAMFPSVGPASDAMQVDPRGGLYREAVADLLRQINAARENGDDPLRGLRAMRNQLERALDLFDLAKQ